MKSFEEIIIQESKYINDWKSKEEVINDFSGDRWDYSSDPDTSFGDNANILFASYSCANYTGDAWVLFEQGGKLYEVNGGHCSCYGLEGQWNPEEVVLEELENRLINGTFGEDDWSNNNFKKELCEFLGVEFKYNTEKYY